jgi:hypothetical protein
LSWATTGNPALALASAVAFVGAELVDMGVFTKVQDRWGFITAAMWSSVVAAPVDTVLFLWIAEFPVTWESVWGQFVGKVIWATLIPLGVWIMWTRHRVRVDERLDRCANDLFETEDPFGAFVAVAPLLTASTRRRLADRLDVCPVHLCDAEICADDEADCLVGRGR